jgi:hypothetical protein
MEPGIKEFFRRLVTTISFLVLWMVVNIAIGIQYGYGFFEGKIHWYNIVFYAWVLLSLAALIWFYVRLWKKPIENLND